MNKKSLKLVILWWVETIAAARILLFTIPVLSGRFLEKSFSMENTQDGFMVIVTFTALFCFMIGLASIFGHKWWIKKE